jgi:hypothetical protein
VGGIGRKIILNFHTLTEIHMYEVTHCKI